MPASAAAVPLPRLRVRMPAVVTPTLLLFAGALALGAAVAWLSLTHVASPWVTVPLHVAAMFAMFVVVHECAHHAAGRLTWLNDVVGRLAMPFVSAVGAFASGRYLHLEQHRRRSEGHLTQWNVRGPAWQLPLRWMVTDLWHLWAYFKRIADRPQLEVAESLGLLLLVPGTLAAVAVTGHGWELVVVYLLPQRIALGLSAWWFDWFPRNLPPDARSYHRVHSRYPNLPFYLYPQAWRADHEPPRSAPPAPACPGVFHSLVVSSVRQLTEQAVEVGFTVPAHLGEEFRFTPGQHVVLRATIEGEPVTRPYAISSCPGDAELRVAIKRVPGGQLSTYATTQLRAGDRLAVRPPAGQFVLGPSRRGKHVVAVAAGVGIAPLLPMLAHELATSPRSRATLLYTNRCGTSTMFADELTALARRFEGRLRIEHFRTDEQDPDLRSPHPARLFESVGSALAICFERYHAGGLDARRLRALLACRLHPAKVDEWLVCAPRPMARVVRSVLAEHHVPEPAVRSEEFSVPAEAHDLAG
ncbi:phenylacetic acid degradation protein [Amycolatopsis bartoniae]|uniref:Phenylacetic acid degradation protein n=1 Tax=Amycolatopsis bartoniae TaxID=941986 RepID=A0A8H9IXM2_9PSEU|nr:phenylacetic acid degradation protein [Amycolatopsis bartoniae]